MCRALARVPATLTIRCRPLRLCGDGYLDGWGAFSAAGLDTAPSGGAAEQTDGGSSLQREAEEKNRRTRASAVR